MSTTAFWWERKVRLGRAGGRSIARGLYHELRYESLVAEPAPTCTSLCDFLGVSADAAMLRFEERQTSGNPELDRAHPWRPITPGLRDWRSQMDAPDVERFEAMAGGLLDELGYSRAFPCPGGDAIDHAERLRKLLEEELQSQDREFGAAPAELAGARRAR